MQVLQSSWGHLESGCGQREPSSQPLNTHSRTSRLGDSYLPPFNSAETHQHQSNTYQGRDSPAPAWVQTSPVESPGPPGRTCLHTEAGGREEEMLGTSSPGLGAGRDVQPQ